MRSGSGSAAGVGSSSDHTAGGCRCWLVWRRSGLIRNGDCDYISPDVDVGNGLALVAMAWRIV